MTPKEAYEARKAERKRLREAQRAPRNYSEERDEKDDRIEEMLDRFVTAVERIADALEPHP